MNHNRQLDGLRGIAVLFVWMSHSSGRGQALGWLNLHGVGRLGVYLFFVLSAYLLISLNVTTRKEICSYT